MSLWRFFPWYNLEHRHGALGLMTPHDIHDGLAEVRLAPESARYGYVYAVALNDAGRPKQAMEVLLRVLKLVLVHTPIHASWLNQIEIYFSIIQRKVLTPNDFASLAAVRERLLRFQEHYVDAAKPFQWTFTRRDLTALLAKLGRRSARAAA